MKFKNIVLTTAAALLMAGTASAQIKIYVTGSTAFRGAAVNEIGHTLAGTVSVAYDGNTSGVTSSGNANAVTWTGGNIGGTAVTIKASWSGSGAGVQTVAGAPSFNVNFLPDGASGSTNSDPRSGANPHEAAAPDIAFSDIYQVSTFFNGTFQSVSYSPLVENLVGAVTFKWVASTGFPIGTGTGQKSSYSVTPQLAQALLTVGAIPLSGFTGNNGDQLVGIYATGRNPDSGTRGTTFAESGVGVFTFVQQYKPTISGTTATALTLYPVETINGVSTSQPGNSGESSGSSLRAYLNLTLTAAAYKTFDGTQTNGYLLTYLGVSDANTTIGAATNPAVELGYNGVYFSQAAVEQGQYTFWGYEHEYWKSTLGTGAVGSTNDPVKLTFAQNLRNNIKAETSAQLSPNVALGDMTVQRTIDGGNITSINF
jgi:hypothetical protein